MAVPTLRAAQYLRMSTEHQRYSLANQAAAIADYAAARRLEVCRSYVDSARSGLTIAGRPGLQGLLADAVRPDRDWDLILVLDVSRWGRFQDPDEAAHYEFVCRSAGAPVIYCAEPFDNDQTAVASLLKRMKRLMAAEYSRELSARVAAAKLRAARLGRHPSGRAPYGLRRVALAPDGASRQVLAPGERKAFAGDSVVLRPGPPEEIRNVRRIFRWFVEEDRGISAITATLIREGVRPADGRTWTRDRVDSLLRNALMIGVCVYNRTSRPLRARTAPRPRDAWVRTRLFPPLVAPKLFRLAQQKRADGGRLSRHAMLRALRQVWRRHGRLSAALLDATPGVPSASSYARYFGSLRQAYAAAGYPAPPEPGDAPRLLDALREAHARHGYLTSERIDADPQLPTARAYRRTFGSLLRAYQLADLPHDPAALRRAGRARLAEQRAAAARHGRADDVEVIARLRAAHAALGHVSAMALRADRRHPQPALLRYRFGSLLEAYAAAGLPADPTMLHLAGIRRRRPRAAPRVAIAPASPSP